MNILNRETARSSDSPFSDTEALRRALSECNPPTLLMVYTQLTHDPSFLEPFSAHVASPYAGVPLTSTSGEVPQGVAPELETTLREALIRVLQDPATNFQRPMPPKLMQRMMSVYAAEPVADEFIPMLMEQMGFEKQIPRQEWEGRPKPASDFHVIIIGAGLTGIAAGIKLGGAGYSYQIIEKNPEVGGTWWENRYPGVGVDTPSHFYSYSFAINPEWRYYNGKGPEMLDYLIRVVEKHGIRKHIEFQTRAVSCVFDEARSLWRVTLQSRDGTTRTVEANAIINAQGLVNRLKMPDIPGLDKFSGPKIHTAAWDPKISLAGKRVAQIGTGSSGAQVGPAIATEAAHLTVFQRSKHWVLCNPELAAEVPEGSRWAMRHIPGYLQWFRFRVFWFAGDGLFESVIKDPNWKGPDIAISAVNEGLRQYCLGAMRAKLASRPDVLEKLTPDYPVFSKRIVLDAGWIDMFRRENVRLETNPIDHITENAIVTKDGTEHKVDAIVLATGFNVPKMLGSLKVVGRGGRDLGAEWGEDDPRAYLGITIPGYPNFFMTAGPSSAPHHAAGQNLVSEVQIHYILECLDLLTARGAKTIEVVPEAYQAFNKKIEQRMKEMIWSHPKAKSYYINSKGRNYLSWPYRLVDYWRLMRKPDLAAFVIR